MLYPGGEAQVRTNPKIIGQAEVGQAATGRNEILADFLVSEVELQSVPRGKPIGCPRLCALALPPNPVPNQKIVVGVAALEAAVDVKKSMLDRCYSTRRV